jgi:hypothetical protein
MANTNNTIKNGPGLFLKAAAQMLEDELQFTKSIEKAPAEDFNGKNGYSAGDTVYISKPARYVPQTTADITSSIQDSNEEKVALTLDINSTVGMQISSFEFATEVDVKNAVERFGKPAVSAIAQNVEQRMLQNMTRATYNLVGTAGSTQFAVDDILAAREKMNKFLAPKDDGRYFLSDSTANRAAVGARKGLFQSSSNIAEQYKTGAVGMADGYTWLENELLYVHTRGTQATTGATVNGTLSTQGAATMNITGTSGGTLKAGDVFTVAGVFAVHPITKQTYPFLQQFVVTADNTASGTAYTGVAFSPAVYTTGGRQNVSAFPTNGSAIVVVGSTSTSYTQNLAFHKSAFRMVSVPLIMPKNAEIAEQYTSDSGFTIALVRDFDVLQRRMITRLDFLGGVAAVRPEWASRVTA